MEIKDYYLILKKNLWLIILITVLFAAFAYIATSVSKPIYQSSVAIEINRTPSQSQSEVEYFQFDNYYSQAVSNFISTTVADSLTSASTVARIFETADYPLPDVDVRSLGKTFTTKKKQETSAIIDISYESKDRTQAEKVISAAAIVAQDKINEYSKTDQAGKYTAKSDMPVTVTAPKQIVINTLIATFLGFLISLGVISIRESLK